jgi:hypothetical protein
MDETLQFLETLFAGKPDGDHYILIWLWDGKRSAWFTDVAQAAAFVNQNRSRDVYVGVALSPKDHGPALRLKVEGNQRPPSALVALWCDVDIPDAGHKKNNLPPTVEDALSVLFPGMPPSILVHSGGGIQAWWLFVEPWTIESEEEMRRAGALATRWIRAIRARAAAKGWDVDSVGDLPRVLRVPGTTNCKIPGQPRPTRLLEIDPARRYHYSDLEDFLDEIGAARVNPAQANVVIGDLVYSSNAEPPFQRFQALCDNEPKFKLAWDHLRKDLKDQSASAYDMALANIAVQAEWTDQEIANLLIAHRRRYKEDLKLRDTYYIKTLSKARAAFTSGDAVRKIEELVTPEPTQARDTDGEKKAESPATEEDPWQRTAALTEELSNLFGLVGEHQIIRFTRFLSEPREYAIETRSGCIRLGGVGSLIHPRELQQKIAELAGRMIPSFKQDAKWAKIQQALLDACIDVQVGDEGTNAGLVNSLLGAYLPSKQILDAFNEADETRSPFMREGSVHVHLADFRRWILVNHGDRFAPKELGILMRRAGAEPVKIPCGKTSRQAWKLKEGFVPPAKSKSPANSTPPAWVTEAQPESTSLH